MKTYHEEIVTLDQARKIKNEVYNLNCPNIKVNYKAIKGFTDKIIQIKVSAYDLEEKLEAIRILTEYGKNLRNRLTNNVLDRKSVV